MSLPYKVLSTTQRETRDLKKVEESAEEDTGDPEEQDAGRLYRRTSPMASPDAAGQG